MKNFIPTFEQAIEITQKNECFTHRIREFKGFKIHIFDYLLAQYNDFETPIPEKPEYKAYELRGLCFVESPDGSVRRFLGLEKFFNVNQVSSTLEHVIEEMELMLVMDKMDGSIMRFVELPNKEIVVKSKTFFDNDQTKLATGVYNQDRNLQGFIKESIEQGLGAMLELVSPLNRVVIAYAKTELVLLQIRDEATGEYLDIYSHPLVKKWGIKCVKKEEFKSFAELRPLKETVVNKEGWILFFKDKNGNILLCKWKTSDYCTKHNLISSLVSENFVMEKILENTIDDVIAELAVDDPRRPSIEAITQATNHYIIQKMNEAKDLAKKYTGDKKEWAIAHRKEPFFFVAAKFVGQDLEAAEEGMIKQIQAYVRGETNRLERARKFISEELKCKLMMQFQMEDEG